MLRHFVKPETCLYIYVALYTSGTKSLGNIKSHLVFVLTVPLIKGYFWLLFFFVLINLEIIKIPKLYGHDQMIILHFTKLIPPFLGKFNCHLFLIFIKKALGFCGDFNSRGLGLVLTHDEQGPLATLLLMLATWQLDFELTQVDQRRNFGTVMINSNCDYCSLTVRVLQISPTKKNSRPKN